MKYFTIKELCKSQTATKLGIDNTPNEEELNNLHILVDKLLDPLREMFRRAIIVNSGFRCELLNKKVGGSKTSQHRYGKAADIQSVGDKYNHELYELAKTLDFDQLIWEYGNDERPDWIHISWSENPRHQILKAKKVGGRTVYERVV